LRVPWQNLLYLGPVGASEFGRATGYVDPDAYRAKPRLIRCHTANANLTAMVVNPTEQESIRWERLKASASHPTGIGVRALTG